MSLLYSNDTIEGVEEDLARVRAAEPSEERYWDAVVDAVETVRSDMDFYGSINPANKAEAKETFLEDGETPEFEYGEMPHTGEMGDLLYDLRTELPDSPRGEIARRTVGRLQLWNHVLENYGDAEAVGQLTAAVYGEPGDALVESAERILTEVPELDDAKEYGPDDMAEAVRKRLDAVGLDFDVERVQSDIESVNPSAEVVRVPDSDQDVRYSAGELTGYASHEVEGHGVRGANGRAQPWAELGVGVGRYDALEEGLAVFSEFTDSTPEHQFSRLREFALRTLAADSANRGAGFEETFDRLSEYADVDAAWDVAVRAHRGGRFVKDHGYQQGLAAVAEEIRDADDVEELFETAYAGKFGHEDVDTAGERIEEGDLDPAERTPLAAMEERADVDSAANVLAGLVR